MKNEFVPYEEALALKELGFDEECFAWYDNISKKLCLTRTIGWTDEMNKVATQAPLYQQAFRFFRKKYGFFYFINYLDPIDLNCMGIVAKMHKPVEPAYVTDSYETYEEAELACLRKLIEIVKEKRDEKENILNG